MLKEAKEGLLIALAARPDDAFTNVFLGHTAMSMWNFEEAEECFQRALRHDPVNLGQRISTHGFYLLWEAERRRVENSGGAKCAAG
jgi:tetratricopeptide (TPR) repeat protein